MPPPLNLTALAWVWNAGRKFAARFFQPRFAAGLRAPSWQYRMHPNQTGITVPTTCAQPNRPEVELASFDTVKNVVIADLGALLADSDIDQNTPNTPAGCTSGLNDPDCGPIFANLGLPFHGVGEEAANILPCRSRRRTGDESL
ncbi:MAG: MbnP family protein [Bryobacteraceae bacterium]|jgi:hypothetical protein